MRTTSTTATSVRNMSTGSGSWPTGTSPPGTWGRAQGRTQGRTSALDHPFGGERRALGRVVAQHAAENRLVVFAERRPRPPHFAGRGRQLGDHVRHPQVGESLVRDLDERLTRLEMLIF